MKLTSSRIRSLSQWTLYDPAQRLDDVGMTDGAPALIDLDTGIANGRASWKPPHGH